MAKVEVMGISLDVNEKMIKDVRTVELFCELNDGNPFVFPKLCKILLGADQYKKVVDELQDEDGFFDIEVLADFFTELIGKSGYNLKN